MHNFESGLLLNKPLPVSLGDIVERDNLDLGRALICIDLGGRDREIFQSYFEAAGPGPQPRSGRYRQIGGMRG